MKHKLKWDEKTGILFFAAGVVMLGISVYLCFSSDIWYDELFTMGLGNQSLGGLVSITARDVHPPLYYCIVSLFMKGAGEDLARRVIAAKLASVLPFLLCALLGATRIRKHFGWLGGGFFCFLLVSMPQLSQYTVEVRMYGYALLFITAALVAAYEIWTGDGREQKAVFFRFGILTVCALAACYTHYFACVAAVMVYGALFGALLWKKSLKKNLRAWLVSGGICAALYLPWFWIVVRQQVAAVSENYWIQPVSLRTLGGCVKFLFLPAFTQQPVNVVLAVLCVLLYGAVFGISAFRVLKGVEGSEPDRLAFALGGVVTLAGIVIFGITASLILRPIFVYRYMLPALGVFWLAFAVLLSGLKEKKKILIPILLLFGVIGIRNFRAFYGEEMWKRVQMEQVQTAFEQIKEEDLLLYNFDQTQAVVSYYLPNESYLWYGEPEALIRQMYPQNHGLVEGEFSDEAGIEEIRQFLTQGKSVWYLGSGNVREEILEKWKQAGILSQECSSVMLERYWFNMYRLRMGE